LIYLGLAWGGNNAAGGESVSQCGAVELDTPSKEAYGARKKKRRSRIGQKKSNEEREGGKGRPFGSELQAQKKRRGMG